MKRNSYNVFVFLIVFFLLSTFSYAGRPLTTDDAYTVEKGKFELEVGYDFIQNNDNTKNCEMSISLKFGINDWLDLGISAPFIIKEGDINVNEWEKIEIGLKFSILKEKEKSPGISLTILATPNPDEEDLIYAVNSILTKNFGKTTFHLNLGTYSLKTTSENKYFFTYSTAFEYSFSEKFNLCGELVGQANGENPIEMLIGINYFLTENLMVDLGFAFGLNTSSSDWRITTGLTFNW